MYMHKKTFSRCLLSLLFIIVSANNISCQRHFSSSADKEFLNIFTNISFNKELELGIPKTESGFDDLDTDEIYLMLVNNSPNSVEIFTQTILLYFTENGNWLEITDLSFSNQATFTLGPVGNQLVPDSGIITVIPDPRETEKLNLIRVVVLGEIDQDENQPKKQVGAFIDVPIKK